MRILDENDFEIAQEDVDHELGYLVPEEILIAHHDAVPAVEQVSHFEMKTFYFTDGTQLDVESQDDPHIVVVDDKQGVFEYVNLPGEDKEFLGADLNEVIDIESAEEKEAWDEKEEIQRYIRFTEEELATRKEMQEKAKAQQDFMENGPSRLETTEANVDGLTTSVDDLTLMMAEMVAM